MLIFLVLIFLLGAVTFVWACFETGRRSINLHQVKLKNKTLSQPLRILHLSDTHFARPDKSLSRFFDRLAQASYDFIVITGDIFDCEEGIPHAVENLKKLKAKHGIYAVFGNHDYYDYRIIDIATMGFRGRNHPSAQQPVQEFSKALKEAGVQLLINERAEIKAGNQVISVYGLDDPTTGHADIEKAMHQYDATHVNLLLTHTIDAFFYIGEDEIDLAFTGHSHGGQICLPWIGALITHTQFGPAYVEGIKILKGAVCSISRGIGTSRFLALRLLAPPEAILLIVEGK